MKPSSPGHFRTKSNPPPIFSHLHGDKNTATSRQLAHPVNITQSNGKLHYDHIHKFGKSIAPGLILSLHPANERRRYKVTPSPIGWAQT